MMRAAIVVVVLLTVLTGSEGTALAGAPAEAGREAPGDSLTTSIVVAPFFGRLVEELLALSATLRDQYQPDRDRSPRACLGGADVRTAG